MLLQLEGFVKIAFSVDYTRLRGYSAGVKRTDGVSNIIHVSVKLPTHRPKLLQAGACAPPQNSPEG